MELNEVNLEKLMETDVKMREKIADLENQIKDIKVKRDQVQFALNEACKALNVSSLKTKIGTLTRSMKTTYVTNDWPAMWDFIKQNDVPEFLHKRLSSTNIKEFLANNPNLMPQGMSAMNEYTVVIRKARETKETVDE
jgi:hypothetical protein